ncbi:protoporphyrinogen oxidase [Catenulispora yoronensis]|uniref:protoporphyrinogen oxidase n=1 Tax=Catenulispora yoronensis TaxID=450799 RepID=UPI0031CE3BA4
MAVIGGGISGLAAAWYVKQAAPQTTVTVFEGSPRLGGKLAVGEVGGVQVDLGAESILNRRPEAVDLVRAVGLAEDVVHPASISASVWSRGELVPMPKGHLMGIPADPAVLAGLLSPAGLKRAESGPSLPSRARLRAEAETDDVAVGTFVADRFGPEVVDRLVEPLLGGVYAGHAAEISLRAAVPALVPAYESGEPLDEAVARILGAQPAAESAKTSPDTAPSPTPTPVFAGIRGGIGRFPTALAQACEAAGIEIRRTAMVRELSRTPDGWRLVSGPVPAAEAHAFDAVIVAVPGTPAARLLQDAAPVAAAELAGIEYASVALATFVFDDAALPGGSGFLVPPSDGRFIKASTFSSEKWSWLAESAKGRTVVRASVGRHRETADLQRDDAELAALALADLRTALGRPDALGTPLDAHVQRWGGGLPQYAVGHVARVARIREAVASQPGLAVCGAAYDGVGIAACVASARRAAREITQEERLAT